MTSSDEPSTCWLQDGLRLLYEDRKHCDVRIHVQREMFPCHKVVLSAASKYFDAMFSSGMKEAKTDSAKIEDVNPNTFKDMLAFIYNHGNVITTDNVEELLLCACRFQILPLKEKCVIFLLEQLSPENSVGFLTIGRSLACERLAYTSLQFVLDNFDEVAKSEELLSLESHDLLNLISNENLKVQNEETVCRAVFRWVDADEQSRREFMPELLREMRLCQVSLDFILDEMFMNQTVYQNEKCTQMIKTAIKYHAMPETRHMFQTMKVRMRNVTDQVVLTWVLGKRQSRCGDYITEFIGYCEKDNMWYSSCTAPVELGDDFAACPLGDDLFVSGGTTKPNCLYYFSSKLCKWIEKPHMKQGRYRHAMVAVNKTLYVLGGNNFGAIDSVEMFDLFTNTWQNAGELKHAVDAASVAVHGGKIFIFGGWRGFSEESSAIQCFDTATNTCTLVGNLPSPQKETRAVTFENKTYITCTNGDIYCFQPESGLKLVNRVKDFNKRNFGIFKDNTSLYLLGGELIDNSSSLPGEAENSSDGILRLSSEVSGSTFPEQLPVGLHVYSCHRSMVRLKFPLIPFSDQLDFM